VIAAGVAAEWYARRGKAAPPSEEIAHGSQS